MNKKCLVSQRGQFVRPPRPGQHEVGQYEAEEGDEEQAQGEVGGGAEPELVVRLDRVGFIEREPQNLSQNL